jgi:acetoin utilization protein AcuB
MVAMRVSALPVLDDGRLVGLLTETDGLAALVTAIGAGEGASRLEVVIAEGQPANLADVVATLESTGNRILGMLTSAPRRGLMAFIFRVLTEDPQPLVRALEAKGHVARGWTPGECSPQPLLVAATEPPEA